MLLEQLVLSAYRTNSSTGRLRSCWVNASSSLFDTSAVYSGNIPVFERRINTQLQQEGSKYRIIIRIHNLRYQLRLYDLDELGGQSVFNRVADFVHNH